MISILQAIVTLRTQYRMAESIMSLANHLVYNGQLQCGSAEVAEAVLPTRLSVAQLAAMPSWLQRVRFVGPMCICHWLRPA